MRRVQIQRKAAGPVLSRWSYGSGAPPLTDFVVVPKASRERVDAAMGLLERVATQPKVYPVCHKYFETKCPGGSSATFADLVKNSVVWETTKPTVWARSLVPHHIAFERDAWRWGRWTIAGAFVHEMLHNCGQDDEKVNDTGIERCGFPDIAKYLHSK
jgi:hypothetical protein